jgi:beta-N-acetylhexosaminidase
MEFSPPTSETNTSLQERIGQMLLVGFRGLTVDDQHPIVQDIRERSLGGVVLFSYDRPDGTPARNVASPAQLKALNATLQAAAATPLLIAIDQEGGKISRLPEKKGFPPTVSAQALGSINDPAHTYAQELAMAETLAGLGVNLNLAPVVDLNSNPDNPIIGKLERSFSSDPAIVTSHALEFIRAHHERGVQCTLKHFPGHGSSADDSHLGVVDVTATWSRTELEPYAAIIKAGAADAIMTAHVFNAKLDPRYPATLSKPIITGILRGELGYDGVVLSDDMQMGAITQQYGFDTAIATAIEAGVDILTLANNVVYEAGIAARALGVIERLVRGGQVSEARIDESFQRIQRLKRRIGMRAAP